MTQLIDHDGAAARRPAKRAFDGMQGAAEGLHSDRPAATHTDVGSSMVGAARPNQHSYTADRPVASTLIALLPQQPKVGNRA